jgi:hypothetical protein
MGGMVFLSVTDISCASVLIHYCFPIGYKLISSRDSAVGIVSSYTIDSEPEFESRKSQKCLLHSVQTGSGAHPVSYPMGTGGSFPGDKAAGS